MRNSSSSLSKQRLSRSQISFLRLIRSLFFVLLSPLDYFVRLLNNKSDFPPIYLRRHVGPLRSFESSGAEFFAYLRLLAELKPGERILDVGCGCGLMALYLEEFLDERGHYVGVDLHGPSISWCLKTIGSRRANFKFQHIDLKSAAYNSRGEQRVEDFKFPFESGYFDVILCKSVFTHMRPAEVENYLKELSRLLKNDGRCIATFFLLNDEQRSLAAEGRNTLEFNYSGTKNWRYVYEHSPESASAYEEGYVMTLLRDYGLAGELKYGTWSGRKDALSFQDLILIRKSGSDPGRHRNQHE